MKICLKFIRRALALTLFIIPILALVLIWLLAELVEPFSEKQARNIQNRVEDTIDFIDDLAFTPLWGE